MNCCSLNSLRYPREFSLFCFHQRHFIKLSCFLFQLLVSTGQFESHGEELLLWLQTLQTFGPCVLDLVSKVMMTYIHNPYPYMDAICDLQNQVAMETNSGKSQHISPTGNYSFKPHLCTTVTSTTEKQTCYTLTVNQYFWLLIP